MKNWLRPLSTQAFKRKFLNLAKKKKSEYLKFDDEFIEQLEDLTDNKIGDEFNFDERKRFADLLKENVKEFLLCDQMYKKIWYGLLWFRSEHIKIRCLRWGEQNGQFYETGWKKSFLNAKFEVMKKTYL